MLQSLSAGCLKKTQRFILNRIQEHSKKLIEIFPFFKYRLKNKAFSFEKWLN